MTGFPLYPAPVLSALPVVGLPLPLYEKIDFLFDVEATDPAVFVLLPLLVMAVALVAVYLPARRAMQADPVEALKHE